MQSSLIGKIQKAHLYAEEPDRIQIHDFAANFRGDHSTYVVTYRESRWSCTCSFFPQWGVCSHIMATQRMLGGIAPQDEAAPEPAVPAARA
ncbi:MAG TPA: hypothetical protein VFC51_17025 [Chloroflexota bacterium]|nr:hypothetical protein [Chloroflexota bacterium]